MRVLLPLMLKEEFRLHTSFSSRTTFMLFPLLVFVFSFIFGLGAPEVLKDTTLVQLLRAYHLSIFMYAIGVGAFSLLGKDYIERHQRIGFLVAAPKTQPITFRKTFLALYLRDVIFYILLMLAPFAGGMALSSLFTPFRLTAIALAFGMSVLTFLIGISLSFLASSLYVRSQKAFALFVLALAGLFLGYGLFGFYGPEVIIPSAKLHFLAAGIQSAGMTETLSFVVAAIGLVPLLVALSLLMITDRVQHTGWSCEPLLPKYMERWAFLKGYTLLVARELVDLNRTRTIYRLSFSFALPLLMLSFTSWAVESYEELGIEFNTIFYAGMIGFFGVIMYSWLNNIDHVDYFQTLPVSPARVIKARLMTFFITTTWISATFVIVISVINGDVKWLPLSLVIMFVTSIYMILVTAYFTGLNTNSFFFDVSVLQKFVVTSIPPILALSILSFSLSVGGRYALVNVFLLCALLLAISYVFYVRLDKKWGKAQFPS